MAKDSFLWTRTFLDKGKSKNQNFCVRAHQGAFLETILKRSRNAVPAGPGRNRALGRLRGSAGRYYGRPAEPSAAGSGLSARLVRSSESSLELAKPRGAPRGGPCPSPKDAGPRRKRGQIVELTRRPRRSHPLWGKRKRGKRVARHPFAPGGAALAAG